MGFGVASFSLQLPTMGLMNTPILSCLRKEVGRAVSNGVLYWFDLNR